jgi:hypothetical protein
MNKEELRLLNVSNSIINLDSTRQLVEAVINPFETDKCYVQIGHCKYYDFIEAQSLLNNLEKHFDRNY